MSLVTVSDYKTFLKISTTTEDTLITSFQSEIDGWVKSYLNRDIESATYTEYYDGDGSDLLTTNQFPITAITSISYYDGLDSDNAQIWTDYAINTDYERLVIYGDGEKIFMDGGTFYRGTQNIKVVYTAGFTTVPAEIQKACKELMWLYYHSVRGEMNINKSSENRGGTNITYDSNAVQKILKNLDKYRALNI